MKLDGRGCSRQEKRAAKESRKRQVVEVGVCMLLSLEIGAGSCCGRHSLRVE